MPYADPEKRKSYNQEFGAKWSKRNRDRKNAAYARYAADPIKRAKIKARARHAYLVRHYGITSAQFDVMVKRQKGRCLICKEKKFLVVDHCHTTGRVRGLLCNFCNRWLGLYESWKAKGHFDSYLEGAWRGAL